jgi:hypothetical protein
MNGDPNAKSIRVEMHEMVVVVVVVVVLEMMKLGKTRVKGVSCCTV